MTQCANFSPSGKNQKQHLIEERLSRFSTAVLAKINEFDPYVASGRVTKVVGTIVHATVSNVKIGEIAQLYTRSSGERLFVEVIGFANGEALLAPFGEIHGVAPSTEVYPTGEVLRVPVGENLLGRVLDGLGNPIDMDKKPFQPEAYYPVYQEPPTPLKRLVINQPLCTGIRAIDGLLTLGEGQRMGIFAAAAGGKSTLLSMLVKGAEVDVTVLALIGERGREVREFIEHNLGQEGMKKSVLVVATSDKSPMERANAAFVATAIAEYFRDQGKRVLFLMDSVTRFARAQREIGLAAGEPPTRRGFPPSVFAMLPKLLERVGMNDQGSITAMYTVLVEGDDMNEPIADETRSILDGHITLSRKLASANHYPAIDILQSKSRVMDLVTTKEHRELAAQANKLMADYLDVELLVKIGEYEAGSDQNSDIAIEKNQPLNEFLKQSTDEFNSIDDTLEMLRGVLN